MNDRVCSSPRRIGDNALRHREIDDHSVRRVFKGGRRDGFDAWSDVDRHAWMSDDRQAGDRRWKMQRFDHAALRQLQTRDGGSVKPDVYPIIETYYSAFTRQTLTDITPI